MKIKKGDYVEVYQDPLTRKDYEGRAKVINAHSPNCDGMATCMVHFDEDDPGSRHIRLIKVS